MKNKKIILLNSGLLLLIIFSYINKYFSSVLNFSDKHYRSTGGDGLTDGMFLELFLYGCIFLFYIFNGIFLISYLKNKNKKGIITISIFLVLLFMVQITVSKVRQHKREMIQEERLLWVKRAKTVNYKSENLKISFAYTDIMPKNKKVIVQEKGNQIKIYTEGNESRADRILLLEKDTTKSLHEFLTIKDKDLKTNFDDDPYYNSLNKKLQVIEMRSFNNKALKEHTGLSFKDLGISKYNETEHVYFVPNSKHQSRYYAIILMTANKRAATKPLLKSLGGTDYTFYYIDDEWCSSFDILK